MNQPPGANNPWPAAPPAGAGGAGFTQLGEPPPEALQPQGGSPYGTAPGPGPMAGAPVAPTMADPGFGQSSGYGGPLQDTAVSRIRPVSSLRRSPALRRSTSYGSPYGGSPGWRPPRACRGVRLRPRHRARPARCPRGGRRARRRSCSSEAATPTTRLRPSKCPNRPPATVAADQPTTPRTDAPSPTSTDTPEPSPGATDTPPPVAFPSPTPAPSPTWTAPPKPTATTPPKPTTTTTAPPKPTATTPKPKPTTTTPKPRPKLKF